jgi:predicted membrane-bound dolichyl-phosphate-mannose-protein mannosyltransferase
LPLLDWTVPSLAPGNTVTYSVTFKVGANVNTNVVIAVAAASLSVFDPNLANNVAITSIHLG